MNLRNLSRICDSLPSKGNRRLRRVKDGKSFTDEQIKNMIDSNIGYSSSQVFINEDEDEGPVTWFTFETDPAGEVTVIYEDDDSAYEEIGGIVDCDNVEDYEYEELIEAMRPYINGSKTSDSAVNKKPDKNKSREVRNFVQNLSDSDLRCLHSAIHFVSKQRVSDSLDSVLKFVTKHKVISGNAAIKKLSEETGVDASQINSSISGTLYYVDADANYYFILNGRTPVAADADDDLSLGKELEKSGKEYKYVDKPCYFIVVNGKIDDYGTATSLKKQLK